MYENKNSDIPLEDNKEFRSVKNYILKSVNQISKTVQINEIQKSTIEQPVSGIALALAKLIANSCRQKRAKLFSQVDSKLKSKIQEKKQAQGLKTDNTVTEHKDNEEQDITMTI